MRKKQKKCSLNRLPLSVFSLNFFPKPNNDPHWMLRCINQFPIESGSVRNQENTLKKQVTLLFIFRVKKFLN